MAIDRSAGSKPTATLSNEPDNERGCRIDRGKEERLFRIRHVVRVSQSLRDSNSREKREAVKARE